jgi:hypothetical protein
MASFGNDYPTLTQEQADAYFKNTPKQEITNLGNDVVNLPLRELGITHDEWRLGTFFTRATRAVRAVRGATR